jgi:hypothetical protein
MKSFFARMSFPRAVVLFCTLGSIVLGVLVFLRTRRLSEVQAELQRVPALIKEIQTDAYRLSDLLDKASDENLKAQDEPETYIRAIATDGKIALGQIDIATSEKSPARGIEDKIYKITPMTKSQKFPRGAIGNFAYKLEADSRRVKVTRMKLTPFEKVAPGEIGKDQWVYEIELTTRTKVDTAPSGQG